jgi:serine/threonine protein kinase
MARSARENASSPTAVARRARSRRFANLKIPTHPARLQTKITGGVATSAVLLVVGLPLTTAIRRHACGTHSGGILESFPMAPDTSQTVLQTVGDYDLVEKIADGGMGTVYKGRHRLTGETVAVKLLAPHMASNPTYIQRFAKEYTAARAINHPNVVRAIEHGVDDRQPYLVMEFVDGESVGNLLEREKKLEEAQAIRIICEAARGLQQAHAQGMIHRDVKPDNIMVTRDGRVKLADLGLVKEMDGDLNLTRTGRGLGTPHFMAPEQFRNAKNADVRCDVYSLGATLYMMVTGSMPFAGCPPLEAWMKKVNNELPPPSKLVTGLSERLNWAVRRAMDANAESRPRSCAEFIDDLTSTKPIPTPLPGPAPSADWWYVQYTDDDGRARLVKGKVSGIRRSIKEGRLGDASRVLVCRTKNGAYGPLRTFNEFRDLFPIECPDATKERDSSTFTPTPEERGYGTDENIKLPERRAAHRRPHIPLAADRSNALDWLKLGLLIAFAIGLGIMTALLVPK